MKIVTLVDSFKHSFSSEKGCEVMTEALQNHQVHAFCVADGGEGTTQIFTDLYGGTDVHVDIVGPSGEPLSAIMGWIEETQCAILESAAGAGIQNVDASMLNPFKLSSYGVGLHIKAALDCGAKTIIVGLGGSATIDCGFGLLIALGVEFIDDQGTVMDPFDVRLDAIGSINWDRLDTRLEQVEFILASDVTNPLLGKQGATYVFGAQKGLKAHQFEPLDLAMKNVSSLYIQHFGVNHRHDPGAGAAGGLGFALATVSKCTFKSGVDIMLSNQTIQDALDDAELVITGEGKIDTQSLDSKLISGVMRACHTRSIPMLFVCGQFTLETIPSGVQDVICISEHEQNLEDALKHGPDNLYASLIQYFNH